MADLATQVIDLSGEVINLAAAAGGGDTMTPSNRTFLEVLNSAAGAVEVTINSIAPTQYGSDEDLVVSVAAGARVAIGPIYPKRFLNPATGKAGISYDDATDVTVGAFALGDVPE